MIRGVGLRSAVAINVATMVGAGPFITLPLVVAALHGSVSAVAWVTGAVIAVCDGLVWAELSSRYPRSGGTYAYLREAFGPERAGRFVAFLFVWQFLFWAPLVIASGYIGFAQYAAYLVPAIASPLATHLVAGAVGVVTLAALYRRIPAIARTALVLGTVALVTLLAVAVAGFAHPYAPLAHTVPMTLTFGAGIAALGPALVLTLYDYSGYADVCALGDEVIAPARTIPRAVVLSVAFVAVAYLLLNLGVAVAVSPAQIMRSSTIASVVAEHAFGAPFAVAVTVAVMVTAFASTYGLLLAASRIPYAAALEGDFLAPFARLHRSGRFPAVSLVTLGLLALPASLLPLDVVIAALTAGIVLVQGVAQIVALAVVRTAKRDAPFRVPLYPLPALIALAGWLFLFASTGAAPIAFGIGTLCAGAIVYLVRARVARLWPFAAATAAIVAIAGIVLPASAAVANAPAFGHAVIARDAAGEPLLRVDGKPFFFLGGAFFYERIPRSEWRRAMLQMRDIGANTLDLYIPWNWHELADGDFDFTGRTSPRRDLGEVLRLGKELGFHFVVRPGPVIRNEWRNGGYPAWLLRRPEYGMPLHDVLEGRYPATATLQNAQSDAAASQWLRNRTHRSYAARWLRRALAQFRPVADRVLAVQLDDDEGAYLDNDTYPAPHLHAYLRWLEAQVRDVVGPRTPVFINTFEMKVPASSPMWAMGNWYQSDAFAIGEHDRAELAFATATLRTQSRGPLAVSEFQAGWLAGPADPTPRAADPTNTALALGELAGWGVKGLIDFPLQDTLAPFGWEAPFSNAFYAWDAAYSVGGRLAPRWVPTSDMFAQLALYGPALAESHRVADVALPYDGRRDAFRAAAVLKAELSACRERGIACDAIDPLVVGDARLRAFRYVVVPPGAFARRAARLGVRRIASVGEAADAARAPGTTVLRGPHGVFVVVENWTGSIVRYDARTLPRIAARVAPFSLAPRDARIVAVDADLAYLSRAYARGDRITSSCRVVHSATQEVTFGVPRVDFARRPAFPVRCTVDARIAGATNRWTLDDTAFVTVAPRAPVRHASGVIAIDRIGDPGIRLAADAARRARFVDPALQLHQPSGVHAYRSDVFEDGSHEIVLQNDRVLAIVTPDAGGRIVDFGHYSATLNPTSLLPWLGENVFDATGGARDDVLMPPPPSKTDRIARYTHTYPAGTFNRRYDACTFAAPRGAGVYLRYDAPDLGAARTRFERVITLAAAAQRLVVDERFTVTGLAPAPQRAVSLDALAGLAHASAAIDPAAGDAVFTLPASAGGTARAVVVAWNPGDVESATWAPAQSNGTLRLVLAPGGWRRITFAALRPTSASELPALEQAERTWVNANPAPASEGGEVAKRYTQSPQKRPSESSCGFESHLPQ